MHATQEDLSGSVFFLHQKTRSFHPWRGFGRCLVGAQQDRYDDCQVPCLVPALDSDFCLRWQRHVLSPETLR